MKIKTITTILISAILVMSTGLIMSYADEKKQKQLRIKWETSEGIDKYKVQIMDSDGKTVLDKTVDTNYVEFYFQPGKYKIRIGAINKFDKISFWSDWEDIEIRKAVKSKFFINEFPAKAGLKFSGGISYNMVLPSWNNIQKNTYLNYIGVIGFHFGNMKAVNSESFARFIGLELEGSYSRYNSQNNLLFKSKLTHMTGGLNFFIKTRLQIPIQFYVRIGGGAVYTTQKYIRYNINGIPLKQGALHSIDPYAKAGGAIELNFLYALSLNIGADYFAVFYQGNIFHSIRYYALIGFRI